MKDINSQKQADETKKFYDQLYGKIPSGNYAYLWTIHSGTFAFAIDAEIQRAAMAQKAVELSNGGSDVWHCVNPVCVEPTNSKRGSESVVSYQTAIVADIDIRGEAHKAQNLASSFDEAKSFLPFAPSILIHSGNGLQAYWIFDTPIEITDENREQLKRRNNLLLDLIRQKSNGKQIDSVGDLTRIMRAVGTFNYKRGKDNAPLCHIIEETGLRYSPAEIDEKINSLLIVAAPLDFNDSKSARTEINPQEKSQEKCIKNPHKKSPKTLQEIEIEKFRVSRMIQALNVGNLHEKDWLVAATAIKNLGYSYEEFDAMNKGGENYNENENRRRWNSDLNPNIDVGALCNLAKKYGNYDEKETRKLIKKFFYPTSERDSLAKNKHNPAAQIFSDEEKKFLYSGDFSDLDFARRIAFLFQNDIRYISIDNDWLILERNDLGGGVWKNHGKKISAVRPFAIKLADALIENAAPMPEPIQEKENLPGGSIIRIKKGIGSDEIKKYEEQLHLHEYQKRLGFHLKKKNHASDAIETLVGISSILIRAEDINRNKHLLNVLNGVVDLQTGSLLDLDPNFLITNQINAIFDPKADTAFVQKFFSDILPDEQTRRAVFRHLGYCLTGEKNYHTAHFWKGTGANGKSTALDLILKLFGSYAKKMPTTALLENRRPVDGNAPTPAIAQLDGDVRLAIIDELPRKARIDTALFKTLTGDETTYSRALHLNPKMIELRAKFIINGNHLPTFDVDDEGMLRRINNVEFTQQFKGNNADPLLPQKLATPENRSAFLKILVGEAVNFYREGIIESDAMKAAKEEYISENDFVHNFLVENCVTGRGFGEITRKALEERIIAAYPRECSRLKKKELLELIISRLEPHEVVYTQDRLKRNVFKNIRWIDSEFDSDK